MKEIVHNTRSFAKRYFSAIIISALFVVAANILMLTISTAGTGTSPVDMMLTMPSHFVMEKRTGAIINFTKYTVAETIQRPNSPIITF